MSEPFTFTLPLVPTVIGIAGFVSLVSIFFISRKILRGVRLKERLQVSQWADKQVAKQREGREESERKLNLFPAPWDYAYRECCNSRTWEGSQIWLKKWLSEEGGWNKLPRINREAVEELMNQIVIVCDDDDIDEEYRIKCDAEYSKLFELLVPHLQISSRYHFSDDELKEELPEKWYSFWKQLERFPCRRELFCSQLQARVTGKVIGKLTPKQATVFATVLGDGDRAEIVWYARYLVPSVVTYS